MSSMMVDGSHVVGGVNGGGYGDGEVKNNLGYENMLGSSDPYSGRNNVYYSTSVVKENGYENGNGWMVNSAPSVGPRQGGGYAEVMVIDMEETCKTLHIEVDMEAAIDIIHHSKGVTIQKFYILRNILVLLHNVHYIISLIDKVCNGSASFLAKLGAWNKDFMVFQMSNAPHYLKGSILLEAAGLPYV
ncbi:hypothetical protein M5K25_022595 [Dendrobium thyrsiflorum]|uniref:DELLA protein n=1 Tax=Dendrobium thyrsiflorum TaxID=117978 RepID=A0ABD0UCN5_DENTH